MIHHYHKQITIKRIIPFVLLMLSQLCFIHPASSNNETIPTGVPDSFVYMPSEGGTQYAILVEKDTQRLFLYAYDGTYKKLLSMNCSTGEVPGDKMLSGDKKTPEGVYFFIKEHKKKYLAPIYGTRAFPMDYPNFIDRVREKNGNSIWLHGTNKPIKARDSNGCVALANPDIDQLAEYITLNRTPIIVLKKISYVSEDSAGEQKSAILNFLAELNEALESGTYHDYLACYGSEYLPDISWWSEWGSIKKEYKASNIALSVDMKKVSVFRHDHLYVALFDQVVGSGDGRRFIGSRKLFITRQNDRFAIVGDVYQVVSSKSKSAPQKNPLVYASRDLKTAVRGDLEIAELVDGWLQAWSSQDMRQYGKYYASDFRFKDMDLKAWLSYKRYLSRRAGNINVLKDNLEIKQDKNQSRVSFVQTYESDGYSDVGIKLLRLKREGGRWKIYRETWKKM